MGHVHVHSAEERNVYYLDQLCTIGFCAALGVVQILLYRYGVLDIILAKKFHVAVLWSGIVLTALAVLRAVALWAEAGKLKVHNHPNGCCDHDHDHAHEHGPAHHEHRHEHEHVQEPAAIRCSACGAVVPATHFDAQTGIAQCPFCGAATRHEPVPVHDHEHGSAENDCGHSHGWAPWRYAILLLPILLFLMGMPWPAPAAPVEEPAEPGVQLVDFKDLYEAVDSPRERKDLQGQTIRVKGMFGPSNDPTKFQLYLLKMTCCFADAYPVPLKGFFTSPEPLPVEKYRSQWVYVTGKVEFVQRPGSTEYGIIVHLRTKDDVRPAMPASNPYLN